MAFDAVLENISIETKSLATIIYIAHRSCIEHKGLIVDTLVALLLFCTFRGESIPCLAVFVLSLVEVQSGITLQNGLYKSIIYSTIY